jgi:hypothetical protein
LRHALINVNEKVDHQFGHSQTVPKKTIEISKNDQKVRSKNIWGRKMQQVGRLRGEKRKKVGIFASGSDKIRHIAKAKQSESSEIGRWRGWKGKRVPKFTSWERTRFGPFGS